MNEIVPTILTSDIEDFSKKINSLRGICPRAQIDVIDGKFAENKTLDLAAIRDLDDLSELKVDLHLMVDEPLGWINRALELFPDRIIAHVEKMTDLWAFVNEVIESGTKVGLAIDLETPVEKISEDTYLLVDTILLMGVKAGRGGQEFNPTVLEKIKKVRKILGNLGEIGIDGGLNEKSITFCKEAGANIFYVGNTFWQAGDLGKRYNELLKITEDRQ